MSAIDQMFDELRSQQRKALMPFVTAGDPHLGFTAQVLREMVAHGASMCEIGIPYSDPIADGPVIQASYTRALDRQIRFAQILEMLTELSPTLSAPLVSMNSFAIIHRHGPEKFVDAACHAGLAGTIVPDLPVEESQGLAKICRERDFSLIQLVTPATPRVRAQRIADSSSGFIYYVSVTGITGERTTLPPELAENVAWLREQTPLPVCIGFGISSPEHVRLLAPVADGFIVGSAIVRRLADAEKKPQEEVLRDVGAFVGSLSAATL